jgi:hypothetical protein
MKFHFRHHWIYSNFNHRNLPSERRCSKCGKEQKWIDGFASEWVTIHTDKWEAVDGIHVSKTI